MNTIGKILVILNFAFALVLAAFLAINHQTSINYKTRLDEALRELAVVNAARAAVGVTNSSLQSQVQQAKADLETKKLEVAGRDAEIAALKANLDTAKKEGDERGARSELNTAAAVAAQERMLKENAALKVVVVDREDRANKALAKNRELSDLTLSQERDISYLREKNVGQLAEIQQLRKQIVELQQPGGKESAQIASLKNPLAANPPARDIKGYVERVDDKDPSYVKVSVGSDNGLGVGNTLEIYRTNAYLGMMRIVDAHNHTSVGKLITLPGGKMAAVREGDIVVSSIEQKR